MPRAKKKAQDLVVPKCYMTYLVSQVNDGHQGVCVHMQYDVGHTDKVVRVGFRLVDVHELRQFKSLGEVPYIVVHVRSRPNEEHFLKREIYIIIRLDAPRLDAPPSWIAKKYDFRQDIIDAVKKLWNPSEDWQEEYPEGFSLMVSDVEIPDPIYVT